MQKSKTHQNQASVPDAQKLKLDVNSTLPVQCEKCNCDIFMEVYKFRKVPKLITGTSKDAIIPVVVYICTSCGHINPEFDINLNGQKSN